MCAQSSQAAVPDGLTMGALYRRLRAGRGDDGWARASIHFEEHTALSQQDVHGPLPGRITKSSFAGELDFFHGRMRRASMSAAQADGKPPLEVAFVIAEDGAAGYSVDGTHFGRFSGEVQLFDLGTFEEMLSFVRVRDARISGGASDGATALTILTLDLDREAFRRLLRAFGGDTDEHPETLGLTSYSLQLTDAGALTLDYWWQLQGEEVRQGEPLQVAVNCHVTISLDQLPGATPPVDDIDGSLPDLSAVDDVWAASRRRLMQAAEAEAEPTS